MDRETRKRRYPEYWDYRSPRTAEEYIENNQKRRRNKDRRSRLFLQKLFVISALAFVFSLLV